MSIVYLNGEFMPIEQAKISPLDRGFLFGDGIYELIPSYNGKMVGSTPHIERLQNGLAEIGIKAGLTNQQWLQICHQLSDNNGHGSLGLYIHVSRGADNKRHHAFPENIKPTIFAMVLPIPALELPTKSNTDAYSLISTEDLRWQRCHIKSTALLGNVLHYQQGQQANCQETLLYNQDNELTEASSSNVYIIKNDVIITPLLDNQVLAGVSRKLLLALLKQQGFTVEERVVTLAEAQSADEIWLSSSTRNIVPVVNLDMKAVGTGNIGALWQKVAPLFFQHKFDAELDNT